MSAPISGRDSTSLKLVLVNESDQFTDKTNRVTVSITLNFADVGWFYRYFRSSMVLTSAVALDHENSQLVRTGT